MDQSVDMKGGSEPRWKTAKRVHDWLNLLREEGDPEPRLNTHQDLLDWLNELTDRSTRRILEENRYSLLRVEVGDDGATGAYCHTWKDEIMVRMIEPFPGLTAERRILREELVPDETMAERGAMKAERLLRDMLLDGRWIEAQRHMLINDIERLHGELREEARSHQGIGGQEFEAARDLLRACLRAGMSAGAYRRRLRELKRHRSMALVDHWELEIRLQRLIEARLGRRVTCLDRWIDWIERVK